MNTKPLSAQPPVSLRNSTLIADSGATKTDWCLLHHGGVAHRFESRGISPVYQSQEEIAEEIKLHIFPVLKKYEIGAIRFYGTGCIPEKIPTVRNALFQSFPTAKIEVYSDLTAAAHALCGRSRGIACIMGTGSNSCEWDGERIVKQISPLGFILGDEGSGAWLGRQLVSNALKNQLTAGLKEKLLETYRLTPADIIDKVYRQPFPSRFLAGLSPFLRENIHETSIHRIVTRGFSDFFERNVMQYDYQENSVHFVGSIAFHYADILKEIAEQKGIGIGKIEQSPMQGLVEYYK